MKVVAAAVESLRLSLRRPLVTAHGVLTVREGLVLRLTSGSGEIGSGEASPAYWLGDGSLARTAADLQEVVTVVRGQPDVGELRHALLDRTESPLSTAAACALDSALVDLEARARGLACCTLLGGDRMVTVSVAALIAGATPDQLAAEAAAAVTRGFETLKLKVGHGEPAGDVRRVAAVRARVGAGVRLRLDANRGWTLEEARHALAALMPFDIEYVEEPMRSADAALLAALARASPVALAVDESIVDVDDLRRLVAAGAPVRVVLKAARVGGPTRLLAMARIAHAAGLPVIVTDSIESTIGMSLAVQVAAALPGPRPAVGLGGAQLLDAEDGGACHPLCVPRLVTAGPGLTVAPLAALAEVGAGG